MKHYLRQVIVTVLMLAMMGSQAFAAPRVIVDVDVVTDNSAKIALRWSDGSGSSGIMITSWQFADEKTLVVFYQVGAEVPNGFTERVISHDTFTFPMKVHLRATTQAEPEFSDISSKDPGSEAVLNLYYRGIIGGYPDGSFKPENNVTRAEFSKMLLLTANYDLDETLTSSFGDVAQGYWARKYIMTLASREILQGKGEGVFDPNGQIKLGEVLAVLTRTFDLFEGNAIYPHILNSHWSNSYFLKAVEDGMVLPDDSYYGNYDAEKPASREQCAVLLSRVLENLHDVTE